MSDLIMPSFVTVPSIRIFRPGRSAFSRTTHTPPSLNWRPRRNRRAISACVPEPDLSPSQPQSQSQSQLSIALAADGTTEQILALLRLRAMPSSTALPLLRASSALQSKRPKVRIAALDALARIAPADEAPAIATVLREETDHSVRAAAAAALSWLLSYGDAANGPDAPRMVATAALREAAKHDKHFIVRYAAVVALGNVGDMEAVPLLAALVVDAAAPPLETAAAVDALGEAINVDAADSDCVQAVMSRAADRDSLIRAAVARTLGRWRQAAGVEDVLKRMVDDERLYGQSVMVEAVLNDVINGRLPPL